MESDVWEQTKAHVQTRIALAIEAARQTGELGIDSSPTITLDRPTSSDHGDLASPVAMGLARQVGMSPRAIADAIAAHLPPDEHIAKVEIAGPGFINLFLSHRWLEDTVARILSEGSNYGRSSVHAGRSAQIEFVSANPTGPLTLGHGRQAVIGDTIARLMEAVGYHVTREYYFNDAGRQMRVLAESVRARYLELLNRASDFPEDGYQGEYIRDIARELLNEHGDAHADSSETELFGQAAVTTIFEDIRGTLERIGIVFDRYYTERSLFDRGLVDEALTELRQRGHVYDKDDATWFRATTFGLPQDRVLVRGTGEPTYRLPDIAYHVDKVRRGFDLLVDVLGADHIDQFPDVLAGVRALGHDTDHITVLIHQFVTLTRDGETVKMSTRRANFVTLDELIDDVGEDVARFFFIMRNMNSHLNFDLDLAKEASNENPVYYLQYAHARIASIFRQAEERGITTPPADGSDLSLLASAEEESLIKECAAYPETVRRAAEEFAPHVLPHYLHEVATAFHGFYDRHRVLDEAAVEQTGARLHLVRACQTVIANGLSLLGVQAPERM